MMNTGTLWNGQQENNWGARAGRWRGRLNQITDTDYADYLENAQNVVLILGFLDCSTGSFRPSFLGVQNISV